jgi:hypothetical protein
MSTATAHKASSEAVGEGARASASRVQAKLSVGRAGDAYEQEADRTADRVVGGQVAATATATSANVAPSISRLVARKPAARLSPEAANEQPEEKEPPQAKLQRQEEDEAQPKLQRQEEEEDAQAKVQRQPEEEPEEEDAAQAKLQRQEEEEEAAQAKVQRQPEEEPEEDAAQAKLQRQEEEETAQAKVEPRANVRDKRQYPVLNQVEGRLFANKGRGEQLDDDTRRQMEVGFGTDFSGVRVHTDADAVAMNRDLKAQAFTHGNDVFFNSGKYEPDSLRGKTLLAHELTHVVQQGAAEQKLDSERVAQNNARRDQAPPEPADEEARQAEQAEGTGTQAASGPAQAAPAGTATALGEAPMAEEAAAGPAETPAEQVEAEAQPLQEKADQKAATAGKTAKTGKAEVKAKGKAKAKAKGAGVGAFLRKVTDNAFKSKKSKLGLLAANEKKKQAADSKLEQTEASVVPPAAEAQSRANAGQVESVEQREAPQPDEQQAKQEFKQALENAVPTTLEQVDKFKDQGKGRVVGEAVKGVVSADTEQVKSTYQEIDSPPEPAPPETEPEALPEIEAAPETEAIDPGDGVVGEVQSEHTDFSEFENQSDDLLQQEGIEEEHLSMVDEGDLAEANKERKQLKTQVKDGPAEVKAEEVKQKQQVKQELNKDEQAGRHKMREQRQQALQGARGEQQKTKSKLELQRQQVTDHINGIYTQANETVKQRLADLETQSLKAFDDGQARATKDFEDNVKRRIDAFKRRRYDRFGGSLLWAKDKLFGMDELPEVSNIFESEKGRFVAAIDGLVQRITAENKRVVQECREIVATARKEIQADVDGLGPKLRQTGAAVLNEMKGKLDALDKQINDKEKELQKQLAEKREAAIKAIEEKIEKMKEAMSGLISKLGNLLLNAMLKFFEWALKKAGYATDQLMGIINKGKAVIKAIVGDPIGFVKNIITAVKNGIGLFQQNIKKHLIGGMISWLTGAMADLPIQLPTKWDLKGILSLVLQILGLTWDRIRTKLVKRIGEPVVRVAEKSVDIVKRLIAEGPIALWEMIKAKAGEIKQQVMEGIRNWAITQLVKQGIIKLVSFLNPAGAIVQAILAIYNTIMFFVENWQRIVEFVKSVFSSIADIAMGKLSKAAQMVERAMGMTIPIILGFLSRLLGLSGIGKVVSKIITKIRKPIDRVVNKVIDKVVGLARKLLGKAKSAGKKIKDAVLATVMWWKKRKGFRSLDGGDHRVYYQGKGESARLMVASSRPDAVQLFLQRKKKDAKDNPPQKAAIVRSEQTYEKIRVSENELMRLQKLKQQAKKEATKKNHHKAIKREETKLTNSLSSFSDSLSGLNFEMDSDLAVKTEVQPTGGSKAGSIKAEPLTWLPGNTKGSSPSQNPPGWDHAVELDRDPVTGKRKLQWVRGHLLNERLHGPGLKWNLVPITQKLNSDMANGPERAAKGAIADKGTILEYHTDVAFHGGKTPVKHFPSSITVKWRKLEAQRSGGSLSFKPKGSWKKYGPFTQGKPPATVTTMLDNINEVGRKTIVQKTGISHRFGLALLEERGRGGRFSGIDNFESRMLEHQAESMSDSVLRAQITKIREVVGKRVTF